MLEWLQKTEHRVSHLRPVAVDLDVLKQQQDELRPLAKEYRDFAVNIDRVSLKSIFDLIRVYLVGPLFIHIRYIISCANCWYKNK